MHTRTLGGSLLVIKGNDCVTIERGSDSQPRIVSVEGHWTPDELDEAKEKWFGPEGRDARNR
jgi:hypothetical protein